MFRPDQSQDLTSFLENIWFHIKHKLTAKYFPITHQMIEAIDIEWNNAESFFCKKLSTILFTRVKHLKKSKGKYILDCYFSNLFNFC